MSSRVPIVFATTLFLAGLFLAGPRSSHLLAQAQPRHIAALDLVPAEVSVALAIRNLSEAKQRVQQLKQNVDSNSLGFLPMGIMIAESLCNFLVRFVNTVVFQKCYNFRSRIFFLEIA